MYAQVCNRLPNPSQKDFESRVEKLLDTPHRGSQLIEYDRLLEELEDALGVGNVMALPFEGFSEERIWSRIRDFTGFEDLGKGIDFGVRDINVRRLPGEAGWSFSHRVHPLQKVMGLKHVKPLGKAILGDGGTALKRRVNNLFADGELRLAMPERLAEDVRQFYEASNTRTSEKVGISLSHYGY
jgi:hypothetical protein